MAANMSRNLNNITDITKLMTECRRMGMNVLGPDVNESFIKFTSNKNGDIRFGMAAIKGAGDAAVSAIIEEREANGNFASLWDFIERINLKSVNKKTLESLAYAGAFDEFDEVHRAQLFHTVEGDQTSGIEKMVKYGASFQAEKQSSQVSLFGGAGGMELPKPKLPECDHWPELTKLRFEKEVLGFYISGHPLDLFKVEMETFTVPIAEIDNYRNKDIAVGGIITEVNIRQTKKGDNFALFKVEDYDTETQLALFRENYLKNAHLLRVGEFVHVKGKVEERYGRIGQFELMPHTMSLLTEILDRNCKRIDLQLDLAHLNERLLADLSYLLKENTGNCSINLEVLDKDERIRVPMMSRKFRIAPSNDLFKSFDQLEGLSYKVKR
jgi:DNA polymerase-3 subunit alpha